MDNMSKFDLKQHMELTLPENPTKEDFFNYLLKELESLDTSEVSPLHALLAEAIELETTSAYQNGWNVGYEEGKRS